MSPEVQTLLAVLAGIGLLLVLILKLKIQAFLSLLIASIISGLLAGMEPSAVLESIKEGMAGTLGFVATVVGLGAIFGSILEHSGGAQSLANWILSKTGEHKASWAMLISGFFIAIPVFFDVAFIILVPMIYALQKKSGKSLLLYGIPLLAGLAITHAFIPPTPGPVAVADILKAELGWVIVAGFMVGIPTAVVAGPVFGKYIANKIHLEVPDYIPVSKTVSKPPQASGILAIILLPILLIIGNTVFGEGNKILEFLGHPFSALILANLLAWYFLGIKRGTPGKELLEISTKSLGAAGMIILLTGAGGVFKQVLIETGAGTSLATSMQDLGIPILLFAFLVAAVVRVLQGSATVSMITAAGMTAPIIEAGNEFGSFKLALVVLAIASGASILSHVNDSGFWLVNRYFGMTEKQTLRSWTVMTTLIAITGFLSVLVLSIFVG